MNRFFVLRFIALFLASSEYIRPHPASNPSRKLTPRTEPQHFISLIVPPSTSGTSHAHIGQNPSLGLATYTPKSPIHQWTPVCALTRVSTRQYENSMADIANDASANEARLSKVHATIFAPVSSPSSSRYDRSSGPPAPTSWAAQQCSPRTTENDPTGGRYRDE